MGGVGGPPKAVGSEAEEFPPWGELCCSHNTAFPGTIPVPVKLSADKSGTIWLLRDVLCKVYVGFGVAGLVAWR